MTQKHAVFALFALLCSFQSSHAASPTSTAIFDGGTLKGWDGNRQYWRVEEGAITGEIPQGKPLEHNEFLYWRGEAFDFDLTLEFRLQGGPTANSGIQYRSQRLSSGQAVGYQADIDAGAGSLGQIYEEEGRAKMAGRGLRVSISPTGGKWSDAFAEPKSFATLFKPGEWNTYRISATASHVEIRVNGVLTSVLDDRQVGAARFGGLIALQLHSGPGPTKIQFRNIRLTQLGRTSLPTSPPAKPTLAAQLEKELAHQQQSPMLWHLQPNPGKPTLINHPKAQELVKGMMVTEGFQVDLVATEPLLSQPVAFTFDERGRIWVAEAYSYPNRQPEGQGKDNIVILEDRDHDGVYETRKLFMEKLNLVSGLTVGMGGVWVGAAPELLFIPDRDRDDKPDGPPQVLLDGWKYTDTHHTLSAFIWGPDGWLYGTQGESLKSRIGKPGTPDDKRAYIDSGVWRYHPVRHEFEVFATGGANQWGLDFNAVGHMFMPTVRSFYGRGGYNYVMRNGRFWNFNRGYAPYISSEAPDFAPHLKNYLLASARFDTGEGGAGKQGADSVYGGHAKVGAMIYLGDNWPDIYRDHLFTHNIFGRQINQVHNERDGSGYETLDSGYDLTYTPDPEHLAITLLYGPDGAVYITDWSDQQHCHNPRDDSWDRSNGRLYRLAWSATWRPVTVNLGAKSDAELVALHAHKNEWYVRTARLLLQERAASRTLDAKALRTLRAQLKDSSDLHRQLNALWTLHVTKSLRTSDYVDILQSPHGVVRAWAVQLGTEQPSELQLSGEILQRLAAGDPSPDVRLALASALPALQNDTRWSVGAALAAHGEDANDRFLPNVIWSGMAELVDDDFSRALNLADRSPIPMVADSIRWSVARSAPGRNALTARVMQMNDDAASHALRLMDFSLKDETTLQAPSRWTDVGKRFGSKNISREAGYAVDRLSASFGDAAALARTRALLADRQAPVADRKDALHALKRIGDPASAPVYLKLLDEAEFRSAVIPLVGLVDDPATARTLIERYSSFEDRDQRSVLSVLTSQPKFAATLLEAVRANKFERKNLNSLHVRQLSTLHDPKVDELVTQVLGRASSSSETTLATIERYRKLVKGGTIWAYDAEAGREVFARTCGACHVFAGAGGHIGPNLTGSSRNGADYFLENIIDPNSVIGKDYLLAIITKKDGSVVAGTIESDSGSALVVRTVSGSVNVPKSEIKSREETTQSMMPGGLLESLSDKDVLSLFKFLLTAQ